MYEQYLKMLNAFRPKIEKSHWTFVQLQEYVFFSPGLFTFLVTVKICVHKLNGLNKMFLSLNSDSIGILS